MKIGWVGTGVMGGPMAGHLHAKDHDVTVWNRTPARTQALANQGVAVADSLATLAGLCDVIFLCVARSEDVQECLDAMTPHARPGTLFVDHSTIAPAAAEQMHHDLKHGGHRFLDAPITGGSMGAQAGTLTIFVGGHEADFAEAEPLMQCYGRTVALVGGPGRGQTMKMANQIAVGGALLGLCECLAYADRAGLDLAQTRQLIGAGAGGSWAFENYGPKVLNKDWSPGFAIHHQLKDFAYVAEQADELGASTPGTELVAQLLQKLADEGHGDWTTAALFDILRRDNE